MAKQPSHRSLELRRTGERGGGLQRHGDSRGDVKHVEGGGVVQKDDDPKGRSQIGRTIEGKLNRNMLAFVVRLALFFWELPLPDGVGARIMQLSPRRTTRLC